MSLFLSSMLGSLGRILLDITIVGGVLVALFIVAAGAYVILKKVSR